MFTPGDLWVRVGRRGENSSWSPTPNPDYRGGDKPESRYTQVTAFLITLPVNNLSFVIIKKFNKFTT